MASTSTAPRVVADQAGAVAAAWSPPGAPSSWRLTAAQFEVLRDDEELLALAAAIPPDRLPPLLFQAAATFLVLELEPHPLRDWFPRVGEAQPPLPADFNAHYRAFCLDHRDRLLEVSSLHRYQMNEVGRCADVLPALSPAAQDPRGIALVDLGTGAGLALHLDRYRYGYRRGGNTDSVGDAGAAVVIETELRGEVAPPIPAALPRVSHRVGIDVEPLDLTDPDVRRWLAACIPQEIGAVTRFHDAVQVALAHPADTVRGDAGEVLPAVVASIPEEALVCLIDTYVHVFFSAEELERFRTLVDALGAERDLDWVSIDPLVPMGDAATSSVLGIDVPPALLRRNRREGVFGVIGRLSYRGGRRSGALLGLAHPGAAWLEWLGPGAIVSSPRHS
ncbi:MAG: DUF2332 domain-containing protein [Solirubrobacterales bacterium]|nr:DUF2332 domain-containing protein [Solirubrobacterales bacterium]